MGMDVYGKDPRSEKGKYFRASVWSWRPLNALMFEVGVITESERDKMSLNDGEGLEKDQAQKVAARLQKFLDERPHLRTIHTTDPPGAAEQTLISMFKEIGTEVGSSTEYSIDREHVLEFIAFCWDCGGFEVH